jgi:hypothetical protein
MTEEKSYNYLYVVEWDDAVFHPPYTVMHEIKLNPEVNRGDFEKFMSEEGFARVGNVITRIGGIAAQYLLTDVTGAPPLRLEDLDLGLEAFGTRALVTKFRVVGSWRRMKEA